MIDYLKIFILSGVPVIEGRGALSIAYLSGLNLNSALLIAILGNIIIIPITFWLLKISNFSNIVYRLFGKRFEKKITKHNKIIDKYEELALLIFVSIPAPVTGAFTAIAISDLLKMKQRKSSFIIGLGVIISCLITYLTLLGIKII
jgi:uncharacterized membrane protein|tara:strand:- start:89 stop:526 length:438 start_codon:yes stop_codon:yes gene_type:complete